jgi:hypothetical protein
MIKILSVLKWTKFYNFYMPEIHVWTCYKIKSQNSRGSAVCILWLSHTKVLFSKIHWQPLKHTVVHRPTSHLVRCSLIYVVNEIDRILQLLSTGWPMLLPSDFQEVNFLSWHHLLSIGLCHCVVTEHKYRTVLEILDHLVNPWHPRGTRSTQCLGV